MITGMTFLGTAILGFLLVLAGLFLGFANSDVDTGTEVEAGDAGGESGVGAGLSLLSLTGIGSVLTGFGLFGYALPGLGAPAWLGVPGGLVGAAICFRLTAWVRRTLIRTLETGTSSTDQDLVYQPATVTVPIPAGGRGRGQVKVRLGDKTFYVSARSEMDRELALGEEVIILRSEDSVCTVDLLQV